MLSVLLVVRMSVRQITKKVMNGFRIRIYNRITLIWEVYKLRVSITDQSIKFRGCPGSRSTISRPTIIHQLV